MRVPAKTRRQQILKVAARLFSRQGLDGTTTREIAKSAQVNEAIIFRHFASKDELYWAAVSEQVEKRGYTHRLRRHLRSSQNTKQALSGLAEILLHRRQQDAAFSRLLLFSALRDNEPAGQFFRNHLKESLNLVADYIRQAVERGHLRKIDPAVGARAFVAMVACHNLVHELFGDGEHRKYDSGQLAQELADIWLNGASARQSSAAPRLCSNGSKRGVHSLTGNGCKPPKKIIGIASKVTA